MKKKQLLNVGCDSGCIIISQIIFNGIAVFELTTDENYYDTHGGSQTFITLFDAWSKLISKYKNWFILYPVSIDDQLRTFVFESLKNINHDEEFSITIDRWNSFLSNQESSQ